MEIPKPDGEIRKLGIPTVKGHIFQQAITQCFTPVYEPLVSESSYGCRPGRNAKDAIQKVKKHAEQGYIHGVALGLLKYFGTLNHEILLNILRRNVKDKGVIRWIERYSRSGAMESEVVMGTEEGSSQGGNPSLLLANTYLNEFGQEYQRRGIVLVRYATDVVLLTKSERAARRLVETSTKYLEGPLRLKVSQGKSRIVSVFAIRAFEFFGLTLGGNGRGICVRVHGKSWKKIKSELKELNSRRSTQSIYPALAKIKVYMRDWLNYYGIVEMEKQIEELNKRLYREIRMCMWK